MHWQHFKPVVCCFETNLIKLMIYLPVVLFGTIQNKAMRLFLHPLRAMIRNIVSLTCPL